MKIDAYETKILESEARNIASNKGNIIGKILCKDISQIKKLYIENKIIELKITYEPNLISKSILKKVNKKEQKIKLIADGSTGGVAYYESGLDTKKIDIEEDNVQLSAYEDEILVEKAKKLARRILRRRVGGDVSFEISKIQSIFRPYYVAFYGDVKEGNKVRYLPIAADGCQSKRTF